MMGNKRLMTRGLSSFIPVSVNFTQLEKEMDESDVDYSPSDDGLEVERLENKMQYEEMVRQIFYNLEDREKLVFAFQLLRDSGYHIDHTSFARILSLSRVHYMRILRQVRIKSALFVFGYSNSLKKDTNGVKKA